LNVRDEDQKRRVIAFASVVKSLFQAVRDYLQKLYSMRVLITVGSTKFEALVKAALSQPILDALAQKGYTDVVVQCGNSQVDELASTDVERNVHRHGLDIHVWRFKPSLDEEYDAADLVIGHAGTRCSSCFSPAMARSITRSRLRYHT
jgi:UDP-N-acetylglucosamine:LPS N-acetylglucosamine transferase